MVHIALVLSFWLLIIGVIFKPHDLPTKILLNLPCYIFSFIVGIWYCKQVGLL